MKVPRCIKRWINVWRLDVTHVADVQQTRAELYKAAECKNEDIKGRGHPNQGRDRTTKYHHMPLLPALVVPWLTAVNPHSFTPDTAF